MKLLHTLLLFLLLLAAGWVQAAEYEFSGKVVAVMDGDTLLVLRAGKPVKLRLAEMDAPEVGHGSGQPNSQKDQPYGLQSRLSLVELVMGKQVQVATRAVDSYGRLVAIVSIDGLNVNHEQVRRGLAWEYSRFHSNKELMALQREAQQAKRGMWASDGNIEPSQWRKEQTSTQAATPIPFAAAAVMPSTSAPKPEASSVKAAANPECGKKRCFQMSSCAEAKRIFARCGDQRLDGDGDGKPCEKLCAVEAAKKRGR